MGKICVCGAFRLHNGPRGGQEIKTTILAIELEKKYGKVYRIDTVGLLNHILLPLKLLYAIIFKRNIIILPAHNGLIVEAQLLRWYNIIFKRRLHYVVIGGWLQDVLPSLYYTSKALHHFYGIYVETNTMKEVLNKLGYTNVYLFPNFKDYTIIEKDKIVKHENPPFRLCTFSRVSEMKGIATAVEVIKRINSRRKSSIFTLDIYGPMEECDVDWFSNLQKGFTTEINYKGVLPYDDCVDTLSQYFALLFPTKFYTEGIPGTIMDAYAAGVPVIASRWKSFTDVIDENFTGYGYEFGNIDNLESILEDCSNNPDLINSLRQNCIVKAKSFTPDNVLPILKIK